MFFKVARVGYDDALTHEGKAGTHGIRTSA